MTNQENSSGVQAARVYLRVSTDEQDLVRQESIVAGARAAGFYVAAVYREKASGGSARPARIAAHGRGPATGRGRDRGEDRSD
jgi:hypothetical protein